MKHDIVEHSPDHFECRNCHQTWQTKPRSRCPGLTLYPQYKCGNLMTETQLDYAGYHTTKDRLPSPVGCYRDYTSNFILLYDPNQAVKKRARQRKVNVCISEIFWPLDCIPFLETAMYLRQTKDSDCHKAMNDVAQMAFQFLPFSSDEIEQNAGGAVHLSLPPMLIHRAYTIFSTRNLERQRFARHIVRAYERQKAAL